MRTRIVSLNQRISSLYQLQSVHQKPQVFCFRRYAMASQTPSEACCKIPPIISGSYQEKGKYIEVNGLKCYHTGPSTATSAIFVIYDIFGYFPQTIQGADILAYSDENRQYQVFLPDFFHGKPFPLADHPPDTDEKKKKFGEFFSGPASLPNNKEVAEKTVEALKKQAPEIKKWGSLGMCWGGKLVSLLSQKGTLFDAGAEVHPALVDANDAKGIQIPLCMLASADEPEKDVKAFEEALTVPKHVEIFGDQVHGWMAARADLEDARVKGEYERGYQTLLEFYHKYL